MIKLGKKFKDFVKLLDVDVQGIEAEILEGQTSAGKTTIGVGLKFILLCSLSKKKMHLLVGYTLGKLETTIIHKDNGILDIAKQLGYRVEYFGQGGHGYRLAHLIIYGNTPDEDKIVLCAGYSDTSKWKDILGNQYGVAAVDEANIADIDFLCELSMRRDYWMFTLNPDDPNMPIYKEFINRSRPLPEWEKDYPQELLNQLHSQPAKDGWIHWYFTMDDNVSLTEEKKQQIIGSVPMGSKQYKNKVLGLRGRSEGLVLSEFTEDKIIDGESFSFMPNERVYRVECGLDSGLNADATALETKLLTTAGRILNIPTFYYVPEQGSNSNSQQALYIEHWLDYWLQWFGIYEPAMVSITGDSAALTQDLLLEINLRTKYQAAKVGAKDIMKDTQRVKSIVGTPNYWYIINYGNRDPLHPEIKLGEDDMMIVEFQNIVWDKKKGNVPEDGNDHCFDAFKYGTYNMFYGLIGSAL